MSDNALTFLLIGIMFLIGIMVGASGMNTRWEKYCIRNNVAHYEITNGTEKVWVWNTAPSGKDGGK